MKGRNRGGSGEGREEGSGSGREEKETRRRGKKRGRMRVCMGSHQGGGEMTTTPSREWWLTMTWKREERDEL